MEEPHHAALLITLISATVGELMRFRPRFFVVERLAPSEVGPVRLTGPGASQ